MTYLYQIVKTKTLDGEATEHYFQHVYASEDKVIAAIKKCAEIEENKGYKITANTGNYIELRNINSCYDNRITFGIYLLMLD